MRNRYRKLLNTVLVAVGASILASCGGGKSTDSQAALESESSRKVALAAVPGAWVGRVPSMSFASTPNKNFRTYQIEDRITSEGNLGPHVRGEILVRLSSEAGLAQLITYCKERKYSIVFVGSTRTLLATLQTNLVNDSTLWNILTEVQAQAFVAGATINSFAATNGVSPPNDPGWTTTDSSKNWGLKAIKWEQALSAIDDEATLQRTPVGILDEGFVFVHEDLTLRHVEPTYVRMKVDHGTHVAGVIGANWNDKGIPGVSKWSDLYVTQGLTNESRATAIPHAMLDAHVRVINFSLGEEICTKAEPRYDCSEYYGDERISKDANWHFDSLVSEIKAFKDAGAEPPLYIQSAGNDRMNYWGQKHDSTSVAGLKKITAEHNHLYAGMLAWAQPQLRDNPDIADHVIIVGSYYVDDSGSIVVSDFSSMPEVGGPIGPHLLFAPGGNKSPERTVWSSVSLVSGTYGGLAGTSQAAPYVTGAASLLFSIYPKFTAKEVKEILLTTADRIPNRDGSLSDHKALNLEAAVKEAVSRKRAATGLIGRYSFESCDGTDSSGLKRDGKNTPVPCVPGKRGLALQFKNPGYNTYGGDDRMDLPFHTTDSITFSAWVKWTGSVVSGDTYAFPGAVWSIGTYGLGPFMSIWINEGGSSGDGGTVWTERFRSSPYRLAPGVWTMLSITSDGTNETFYINGEQISSVNYPSRVSYSGLPSYVSRHYWSSYGDSRFVDSASRFRGVVDEVRVYERSLSSSEIRELYLATQ